MFVRTTSSFFPLTAAATLVLGGFVAFAISASRIEDPVSIGDSFQPSDLRTHTSAQARYDTLDSELAGLAQQEADGTRDQERAQIARRQSDIYVELTLPEQALEAIARAVRLAPDDVETLLQYALLHMQVGMLDHAKKALDHAEALQPRNLAVERLRSEIAAAEAFDTPPR